MSVNIRQHNYINCKVNVQCTAVIFKAELNHGVIKSHTLLITALALIKYNI